MWWRPLDWKNNANEVRPNAAVRAGEAGRCVKAPVTRALQRAGRCGEARIEASKNNVEEKRKRNKIIPLQDQHQTTRHSVPSHPPKRDKNRPREPRRARFPLRCPPPAPSRQCRGRRRGRGGTTAACSCGPGCCPSTRPAGCGSGQRSAGPSPPPGSAARTG